MPIFFIAAIGLILFLLFLRSLSQANSHVLTGILQGSSLTILAVSLVLFVVSGRVAYATILAFILLVIWLRHKQASKIREKKRLPPPLTPEEALELLAIETLITRQQVTQAYEAKCNEVQRMKQLSPSDKARLRHAKEILLAMLEKM